MRHWRASRIFGSIEDWRAAHQPPNASTTLVSTDPAVCATHVRVFRCGPQWTIG
jgi:hypothetical protein